MNKNPIGVCTNNDECVECAIEAIGQIVDYGFNLKSSTFDEYYDELFSQIDWYMYSKNPISREQCETIFNGIPNDNIPEYIANEMNKIMCFVDVAIHD